MTTGERNLQCNFKTSKGDLHNIYAETKEELKAALATMRELAEDIYLTSNALSGFKAQPAQEGPAPTDAMSLIQRELGGQVVGETGPQEFQYHNIAQQPTDLTPREQEAANKGFIADRWRDGPDKGGWWSKTIYTQAPPCQCPTTQNHGKLALKKGVSQAGKAFTGWFCVNTYGKSKSNGCSAVFNGSYPA